MNINFKELQQQRFSYNTKNTLVFTAKVIIFCLMLFFCYWAFKVFMLLPGNYQGFLMFLLADKNNRNRNYKGLS